MSANRVPNRAELERGSSPDLVCNDLTGQHGESLGRARHGFCIALVGQVAQIVDDPSREHGVAHAPTAVALADGRRFDPMLDLEPAPKTR